MDKIAKLQKEINNCGLKSLIIKDTDSISYLTSVKLEPHERLFALILTASDALLVAPKMHSNEIFEINPACKTTYFEDSDKYLEIIPKFILDSAGSTSKSIQIGVDKLLPAKFLIPCMEYLDKKISAKFTIGSKLIDEMRMVKTEEEINKMRISSALNDKIIGKLRDFLSLPSSIGITELDATKKLEEIYKEEGADGYSFEPLVCFGNGCSQPHHVSNNTKMQLGDSVIIDIGFTKNSYCSDMTRSFKVTNEGLKTGNISSESYLEEFYNKIYQIVKQANLAGISKVKPGVPLKNIDCATRTIISDSGYSEFFMHRTGHGIGTTVHEFPDVSSTSDTICKEGMIFSVEPGIYIDNENIYNLMPEDIKKNIKKEEIKGLGVRIEDLVLVTKDGHEVLNKYPK